MGETELITEDWLKSVGFRWSQIELQPHKHWILWLGGAIDDGSLIDREDIGIEITPMRFNNANGDGVGSDAWFCWLRSDAAGRYHRFIHLRHIRTQADLIAIIVAISGQAWAPENHYHGGILSPRQAERYRKRADRLDLKIRDQDTWYDLEKDQTAGGALPEHRNLYDRTMRSKT
jgi:hypothetical protein